MEPFKACMTNWESLHTTISFNPKSHAKRRPTSNAFASPSKAPSRKPTLLHIAPIICPLSFLITTLTPQQPKSWNTAASVLILYFPRGWKCPLLNPRSRRGSFSLNKHGSTHFILIFFSFPSYGFPPFINTPMPS